MDNVRKIRMDDPVRVVRIEEPRTVPVQGSNTVVALGGKFSGTILPIPKKTTSVYYDGEYLRYPEDYPECTSDTIYSLKQIRHKKDKDIRFVNMLISQDTPNGYIRHRMTQLASTKYVGYIRSGFSKSYFSAPEEDLIEFIKFAFGDELGHEIEQKFITINAQST